MHGLAGDQREERGADGPDVGLRVDLRAVADRLLRRHETRRTEEKSGRRDVGPELGAHLREAEVEDLEATFVRDEEVVRLDVAMNDPLVVRGREHVEELLTDLEHVGQRKRAALPDAPRLEELALEQLHHEIGVALVRRVVVEDADDTRMIDLVRRVAFLQEATARVGVARELRVEDLDRGAASVVLVRRGVDRADAAARNAGVDPPSVAQDPPDPALSMEGLVRHDARGPPGQNLVVTNSTMPMMKMARQITPTPASSMI